MENYGVEGNILAYSHYLVADEKLQGILFERNEKKITSYMLDFCIMEEYT